METEKPSQSNRACVQAGKNLGFRVRQTWVQISVPMPTYAHGQLQSEVLTCQTGSGARLRWQVAVRIKIDA